MSKLVSIENNLTIGVMVNLFFILLIAVFAVRKVYVGKRRHEIPGIEVVKEVTKSTLKYALLATTLVGTYYYILSPTEVETKRATAQRELEKFTEEEFIEQQETQEMFKGQTYQEFVDQAKANQDWIYDPFIQITFSLIALVMAAIFNAILISLLWRNFMVR
ncbi:MAG: hypothetical protein HRT74_12690 [Flavobacteriales bacterium]|nr:hypothetical protein [Flavobacteriales bacterium]